MGPKSWKRAVAGSPGRTRSVPSIALSVRGVVGTARVSGVFEHAAVTAGEPIREVTRQRHDVVGALAQRRQHQRRECKACEQVGGVIGNAKLLISGN